MIRIKEGDIINLAEARSGIKPTDGKSWYNVKVAGDRGTDRITVWAANPDEVKNFRSSKARVKHITEVSLGARLYGGKWWSTTSCEAYLEEVVGSSKEEVFGAVDDSELPFM